MHDDGMTTSHFNISCFFVFLNNYIPWYIPLNTVKGQSRSDSLLLSPYHWAKLFRGVVAIVAVSMRFAMICWVVLEAFVGQIHVFPLGSWMTILYMVCWGCSSIFGLHGGNVPLVIPLTYLFWMGGRLIFFTWWFGMKKGCGGAGSCALHGVVNDGLGSCVWQLMNQGSCVLCLFLLFPSFIFFSCFLTNCHFFSFHVFLCSLHLTPSQIKPFWQNDCL